MKVLVADKISDVGIEFLQNQKDLETIVAIGSTPEQILELAKDVSAIIVRSETKITAEVMKVAKELKAVGRAGVGVDNIDIPAATQRGVVVMNTPSGNTIATAELTFTHMLAGTRPIAQANATMKAGQWNRKAYSGSELRHKTLGILGMGRIGSELAKRAQAFEMNVLAYDPFLTEDRAKVLGVEPCELDALLPRCDYITVHMPLTEATKYMLDEKAFEKMKDGVRVFNCARGGIIKEAALVEALKSGKCAGAGLDVFETEPLPDGSPLREFDNVVLTPHLGASTVEAQESVGIEIAEAIVEVLRGGVIRNAVNMPSVDPKSLKALAPFMNLGEKLGTAIQQLAAEKVVRLRMTFRGTILDYDIAPLSRAIQKGYLLQISGSEVNDVNAPHILKGLGIEVEVVQSNETSDYTELVEVAVSCADGKTASIAGTLIGTNKEARIVAINGRDIESSLTSNILIFQNDDKPGIVGFVGTVLGKHNINIANMALSRQAPNTEALNLVELDSVPSDEVLAELTAHEAVNDVRVLRF